MLRLCRRLCHIDDVVKIAQLLDAAYPNEDPDSLKPRAIEEMLHKQKIPKPDVAVLKEEWKKLYMQRIHETAFEETANPGELCDGELPSWRDARMRVEEDATVKVPSVSANEAARKLKKDH